MKPPETSSVSGPAPWTTFTKISTPGFGRSRLRRLDRSVARHGAGLRRLAALTAAMNARLDKAWAQRSA